MEYDILINKLKIAEEYRDRHYDGLRGKSYYNEVIRLKERIKFVEQGLRVEDFTQGLVKIGGIVVSLRNKKYMFPGNNTWYRYGSTKSFIERYWRELRV